MKSDYLPRHADAAIAVACARHPVVIVDGARGVGKTTSARRLAASVLEFPRDLERVATDPQGALAALPGPVLVDEWQLAGVDLMWAIKRIVDDRPGPGQFILTGSVEPATYGPTYPLTGRAVSVAMRPMSAAELNGIGAETTLLERIVEGDLPTASAGRGSAFAAADIARTGFPGAQALPDAGAFLEGYAALLAQRAGDEGRDASRLHRALRVLATLEAQATPAATVWEAADVTKVTWSAYADLLQRTHVVADVPAFHSNRLKRLTSYPKRFLADSALALTLAGLSPTDLAADHTLAGRYLESYVMQQLRPQVDRVGGTLTHVRLSSGEREVDGVIEVGPNVIGVEVKATTTVRRSDARHLEWLRDQLGARFTAGLVVHTGGDTHEVADRVWAVPVDALTGAAPQ